MENPRQFGPIEVGGLLRIVITAAALLTRCTAGALPDLASAERCLRRLKRAMRDLLRAQDYNQGLRLKTALLNSPHTCAQVIKDLGGEPRLTRWEAAQIAAQNRQDIALPKRLDDWHDIKRRINARASAQSWRQTCALYGHNGEADEPKIAPPFRLPPIRRRNRQRATPRNAFERHNHSAGGMAPHWVSSHITPPRIVVTPQELREGAKGPLATVTQAKLTQIKSSATKSRRDRKEPDLVVAPNVKCRDGP